jgi:hypothetical protein
MNPEKFEAEAAANDPPKKKSIKLRKLSMNQLNAMILAFEKGDITDTEENRAFVEVLKKERIKRVKLGASITGRRTAPKGLRGPRFTPPKKKRR